MSKNNLAILKWWIFFIVYNNYCFKIVFVSLECSLEIYTMGRARLYGRRPHKKNKKASLAAIRARAKMILDNVTRNKIKPRLLRKEDCEIIHNVYQFMNQEYQAGLVMPLNCLQDRVARAAGVSLSTVESVGLEGVVKPEPPSSFTSPTLSINKSSPKSVINKFDERIIRKVIYTHTMLNRQRPSMETLFQAVKSDGVNIGKMSSFRKIVQKLGFQWRKAEDNMKLLWENIDIRLKRIEYIRRLKYYKEEGRNIVYYGETYIHKADLVAKPNNSESDPIQTASPMNEDRVIIVHCGGRKGLVPKAAFTFIDKTKTKDYTRKINYEKWFKTQLLPNLEPNSVLVVDSASYLNEVEEPDPPIDWKKADLQKWLNKWNIYFDPKSTKPELWQKIQLNKPLTKVYVINKLLSDQGHTVLRLPPCHPELNPMEHKLETLKIELTGCNKRFNDVGEFAATKLASITPDQWGLVCDYVEKVEDDYMSREYVTDEVQDRIGLVDASDDSDFGFSSDDNDENDFGRQRHS